MASSQFLLPVQSPASMSTNRLFLSPSSPLHSLRRSRPNNLSTALRKTQLTARAEVQQSDGSLAADALRNVKHVLLPITDRNTYLSEGTRQAAATTTALAKNLEQTSLLLLLMISRKNRFLSMKPSYPAFACTYQKVVFRSSIYWRSLARERSRLLS